MLHIEAGKKVRVMLTTFRDGLQGCFGGKTRLQDILPAMEAAAAAGIRHFEFGGGARFQAPYFYLGENPFDCMDRMRSAVGPEADLQILTRSVSGVTLTTQGQRALDLQARLMRKHGTTWDRNFDYMNDVDNLAKTGQPIVDAGMHHQACVAMMGLPFSSTEVHTPEFYVDVVRRLLDRGVRIDSVCLKDASGTTDPTTVYETARGIRALLPAGMPLWMHTHDTASMAIACYLAALEGGADGIDLSVRPLASGTVQPDLRAMWHALKGTGYSLDVDHARMHELEGLLLEGLKDYDFDPVTTTPDARVVGFPMPGGAIGPNVHMMKEAGILHRYAEVLAEFPVVVKAAGAWTSVTPGSQQYWLQAFNNVLHGRWKKIDAGYGSAVLGYFGRPPLPPDPEVVEAAAAQLKKEPFTGDPLDVAPDTISAAEAALKERNLAVTDENVFLVAAAIVPGRNMDLNEGIRLLAGKPRMSLPLKKAAEDAGPAAAIAAFSERITTTCTVEDNGRRRQFKVTIDPPAARPAAVTTPAMAGEQVPVHSPFDGKVEVAEICVKAGDAVTRGQVVAAVEAMKAKHEVKAPCDGVVRSVDAAVGAMVTRSMSILTLSR